MSEPETGSPLRLRDTPLGRLPWFEMVLASPLSVSDVCERVADQLDNSFLGRTDKHGFAGQAANGRILISLRGRSTFVTSPSLEARVEPRAATPDTTESRSAEQGSHMRIRLRPGVGTMLWLGAWTFILLLVTAALITQRNLPAALAVSVALLLPWVFYSWLFRRQAPRLLALLEDTCAATRLPSEKPRTF